MKQGFTLLELLIVIAILAILTTVVILVINPVEALKKTRDTQRITDLDNLKSTLLLYEIEEGTLNIPGGKCTQAEPCKSTDGVTPRNINGTGWIPLDFTSMAGGSPISSLPIDPVNDDTYYYRFAAGSSFEIDCLFESDYYKEKADLDGKDGGDDDDVYEAGTKLTILPERGTGCFLASTKVVMADGSLKNIEVLEIGDLVKSYDNNSKEVKTGKVTDLLVHPEEEMGSYYLIINNHLKLTPNHYIYLNNQFQKAKILKIGDIVSLGPQAFKVDSLQKVYQKQKTYDLKVEPYNNYFIGY